jgi:hypothetical protein
MRITWSGSALLGGLMVERWGYRNTFICTLCIQFVATSQYWWLAPLVPRKELSLDEEDDLISEIKKDTVVSESEIEKLIN